MYGCSCLAWWIEWCFQTSGRSLREEASSVGQSDDSPHLHFPVRHHYPTVILIVLLWWIGSRISKVCTICFYYRVALISANWPAVPPAIIAILQHAAALFQQIHSYSCAFRICHSFWTNKQLQHDSCGIVFLFPWKHSVNDQKTCCQQMIWGDDSR